MGEDVEELNPHTLMVGMQNGAATLGNSLAVPQKVEQRAAVWSNHSMLGCVPKRNEHICPHKTCAWVFTTLTYLNSSQFLTKKPKSFNEIDCSMHAILLFWSCFCLVSHIFRTVIFTTAFMYLFHQKRTAIQWPIPWMYHTLYNQSHTEGHYGWAQSSPIINEAGVTIHIHLFNHQCAPICRINCQHGPLLGKMVSGACRDQGHLKKQVALSDQQFAHITWKECLM